MSTAFLVKLVKEAAVAFVVTGGTTFLAFGSGLEKAAAVAGAVAGVRAVVGVVVKDVGEPNSPHL